MWLVVFCLPLLENQEKTKRVESSLVPRLDEGSNPSSSTKNGDRNQKKVFIVFFFIFDKMVLRSFRFRPKRIIEPMVVIMDIIVTIIARRILSSNIECKSNGIEIEKANTAKVGSVTFLIYDKNLS